MAAPFGRLVMLSLCVLTMLASGCKSAAPPATMTLAAADYPRRFIAAREALHDAGFVVENDRYRFGELVSRPQRAPTFIEFWRPGNSTFDQAMQATFNHMRRIARVTFHPLGESTDPAAYRLDVNVMIEQFQAPTAFVNLSTAYGGVTQRLRATPGELQARHVPPVYWQPLRRDEAMEARLVQAIMKPRGSGADQHR